MRRGLVHFHSEYSYDSTNRLDTILDFVDRQQLDFAVLTDHDTIRGAARLAERAAQRGVGIETPLAAEYQTSHGDVIAAFISREIKAMHFPAFIEEVRTQSGLLILPHPYKGHAEIEQIAAAVDVIEVFNGRCSASDNARAAVLAQRLGKSVCFGSDAHLQIELANAIIRVRPDDDLRFALLEGPVEVEKQQHSIHACIAASQMIKAWKQRSPKVFCNASRRLLKTTLAGKLLAPVA